jgi:zinc protease
MKKTHRKTILSNGLTIFLKEIHNAPLVSSWVWYRVGSKDEPTGKTGISHWTEHMQFKGTPRFPAGVLDKAVSREGGVWNAFTFMDWTTYFETMPAGKIDLALQLEADRMQNSLFDAREVESERTVIISEREGSENDPLFRLGEAIQNASFRVHPYHHEVIGDKDDLRTINRDDLHRHYKMYYVPNNAVMALAGDFDSSSMLVRIRDLFEPIPAAPKPPRLKRREPLQPGALSMTMEGPGETTYLQVAYRFPSASHPDFFPLTVLDSLLAGPSSLNMFGGGISNRTSRLYRALVEKEFAVGISGGASATIDPFLYTFTLTVHPRRKPNQALAALDAEIQRVQSERVSRAEIARAIQQARALFAYGSESITNQAFWMGYSEMFANYNWFLTYLNRLALVTPAEVQRVAVEYFRPNARVVGTYLPMGKGV